MPTLRIRCLRHFVPFFILFITITFATTFCASLRQRRITFAHAQVDERNAHNGAGPTIIDDNGDAITSTVDPLTQFSLRLQEGSLKMSISAEHRLPTEPQKSKIELNVVRNDEAEMVLKEDRIGYLHFQMKLAESYELPDHWVLHLQIYQCCNFLYPKIQPPLIMFLEPQASQPKSDPMLGLLVRDDDVLNMPAIHDIGQKLISDGGSPTFALSRGAWHDFVFKIRPSQNAKRGLVEMILDQKRLIYYIGKWGYSGHIMPNSYAVKLGIYRQAQATSQTIYFRDILWNLPLLSGRM